MPDHDEIVRLYGPWRPRTPRDAVALLDGYDRPWWIAGGWAIEAFTGVSRPHGDLDPSILRSDFDVCAPLLDSDARAWLRSSLEIAHPGHRWLDEL